MSLGWDRIESPLGAVYIAANERGIVRVGVRCSEEEWRQTLTGLAPDSVRAAGDHPARRAAIQLAEYFAGRRHRFDLPLDLGDRTEFQRRALAELAAIPFGCVTSYGELAAAVGRPRAARAIGGVMHQNPIPLILPCHRVVCSDGSLGGYAGGLGVKIHLLRHEGVSIAGDDPAGARVVRDRRR